MSGYYVQLIEGETGDVLKHLGPYGLREAEKIEAGTRLHLNREKFSTRIVRLVAQAVLSSDGEETR